MQHLSADRLAELGDASSTPDEDRHLLECAACAHERHAYVRLLDLAHATSAHPGGPLSRWDDIARELQLDSPDMPVVPVISVFPVHEGPRASPLRPHVRWPMQIAAGLLLCVGGAMMGRASVGGDLLPARAAGDAGQDQAPRALEVGRFASVEEARTAQERSHLLYEQATAFLAQQDSSAPAESPVVYRSRLAALDRVISTTRAALREAPHDPVINDYYLTSIGQREVTLRQLNVALPASLRLNSF